MNKMEGRLNNKKDVNKIVCSNSEWSNFIIPYIYIFQSAFLLSIMQCESLHPFSVISLKIASYIFTFSFSS